MIEIKKYGNRRMYDTSSSRYVKLDDVARLVREGNEVVVIDVTSGEDITPIVLTQVIVEGAKNNDCALPTDFLRQLIMASGRAQQDLLARYTRSVFDIYQRAQTEVRDRLSGTKPPFNPLEMMQRALQPEGTGISWPWQQPRADIDTNETAEAAGANGLGEDATEELAFLRKRLEELERRLPRASDTPDSESSK